MKHNRMRLLELATICAIGLDGISDTDPPPAADGGIGAPPQEEHQPELVEQERMPPPPELVEAVVKYFMDERSKLQRKVVNLETLLGFVTAGDDDALLAVRVAKLEAFCGVKA